MDIAKTAAAISGYRLLNTKYPAIFMFNDVASAEEFEILYEIQAMTNPRLLADLGDLQLLPKDERVFGIPGASYAMAAFTHVPPNGSRFSNGDYGVYYIGDHKDTAIAEVSYHCDRYCSNIPKLKFEQFEFRCLYTEVAEASYADITAIATYSDGHPYYHPTDYSASQQLAAKLRAQGETGIAYRSVRRHGGVCWGLFTPKAISSVVPASLHQIIWNNGIVSVSELSPHR